MKIKKLSLQKDTLLPLDASETVNIAGGMLPVSSAIPFAAGVNACQQTQNCTGGTCACTGTCATNCGTCGTCATNCGTCGTCATACNCSAATCATDCACTQTLALRACYSNVRLNCQIP